MSKKKNLIKKIVLDIEGKEISLTPEQAQKLLVVLTDLIGGKKETIKEKEYVPYPIYPYDPPYRPYRPWWPYDRPYYTWSSTTSRAGALCSANYSAENSTAKITL